MHHKSAKSVGHLPQLARKTDIVRFKTTEDGVGSPSVAIRYNTQVKSSKRSFSSESLSEPPQQNIQELSVQQRPSEKKSVKSTPKNKFLSQSSGKKGVTVALTVKPTDGDDIFDDDGKSYSLESSSDISLSFESKTRLQQILRGLFGTNFNDDRDKFDDMIFNRGVEVDEKPNYVEGIFFIKRKTLKEICLCRKSGGNKSLKICVYDRCSLFIFGHRTWLRKKIVALTESVYFDRAVITLIFLASVTMILQDYEDRDSEQLWNQTLDKVSSVLVVIFSLECFLKIISQGCVMHENSYLRDPWNWIDFAVVITGIMELSQIPGVDLKSLRALRVLRPLRSLKAFPRMRKLIQGMIDSLPSLLNAVVFMGFVFLNFAIFGTQQFGGAYYTRCRIGESPLEDGSWPYDPTDLRLCSTDESSGRQCPSGLVCGVHEDDLQNMAIIDYGFTNFNNLLSSMVTIFQCVTLEGWTKIMYNLMDQQNMPWIVPIFFIFLVILGSLFLLNVVLAIFENALDKSEGIQQTQENTKKTKIAISVKRVNNRLKEAESLKFQKKLTRVVNSKSDSMLDDSAVQVQQSKSTKDQKEGRDTIELVRSFKQKKLMTPAQDLPQPTQMQLITQVQNYDSIDRQTVPNLNTNEDIEDLGNDPLGSIKIDEGASFSGEAPLQSQKQPQQYIEEENQDDPFREDQEQNAQATVSSPSKATGKSAGFVAVKLKTFMLNKTIDVPQRAINNKVYYYSYIFCQHPIFNISLSFLIVLNCVVLMIDRYPISQEEVQITDNINTVVFIAFLLEMIIKLVGYGVKDYGRDRFNIFDALIVGVSTIEFTLTLIVGEEQAGGGALTAFRAIRILRIFKLSRKWKAFNIILGKIMTSIKDILTFTVLMLIFMLVFIILGMQFFAFTVYFDANDELTTADAGISPALNFDSVYMSFVTVFAVTIGEDWNVIMYSYMRYNFPMAAFYFCTLILVTNIVLLNLFLALLLQNFSQPLNQADYEDQDLAGITRFRKNVRRRWKRCLLRIQNMRVCRCIKIQLIEEAKVDKDTSEEEQSIQQLQAEEDMIYKVRLNTTNLMVVKSMQDKNRRFLKVDDIQSKKTDPDLDQNKVTMSIANITRNDLIGLRKSQSIMPKLYGKSLYIFGAQNRLRIAFAKVVSWRHYDNLSILAIIISTINLSFDNPLNDPNSDQSTVIHYIDYVMTFIFAVEAITKIIVYGLIFNGKDSYLRLAWNLIDLTVVITSVGSFFAPQEDSDYSFLKAIRVIRFLRPLRLIKQNQRLKIAVQSLINAMPGIFNLMIICMSCLSILAAIGVNLYKGTFSSCQMVNVPLEVRPQITNYWDCLDYGGEWVNSDNNFDDLFQALKTQFVIMCTEGWLEIYFAALEQTKSHYDMPQPENNPEAILYFVISILLSALFILNMFVGVVISTFNIEKEKLSHNTHLTILESEYIDTCVDCYQAKPQVSYKPTGCKLKDRMHNLATRKAFDFVIFGCIIVNSFVLMLQWYKQDETIQTVLEWVNQFLSLVFTIEFVIKLIGFGLDYFKSMWNLVDLFVCLMSWLDFGLGVLFEAGLNPAVKIVRTFRVVRIMKLVRRFKELQRILMTFIEAIPALINVGGLLFLFIYLYSVIGVNFFSMIKLQTSLNKNANFQTFGTAMLTLFRISTGEGWNDIMEDCAREKSIEFLCYDQNFEQRQKDGIQGCGSHIISYFFFMSFMIFVTFIMLNLFIAIILEGFQKQLTEEAQAIQPETIEQFIQIWKQFDPSASGMIEIDHLEVLITKIVQRELHILKSSTRQEKTMFNFHQSRLLRLYTSWHSQTDDGSSQYADLKKSIIMQRQLQRHMNKFLGELYIPTYNKVTHYYFHDILISFIKYFFSQKHRQNFQARQLRIQNLKETGQELALFDRMTVDCKEYKHLSVRDRQTFDEMNSELFSDVVKSIETKGQREEKIILRLFFMKQLRGRISRKNSALLDQFGGLVINSSLVQGAKTLQKFLLLKKQALEDRRKIQNRRRRGVFAINIQQQNIYSQNTVQIKTPRLRRQMFWSKKAMFKLDVEIKEEERLLKLMNFSESSQSLSTPSKSKTSSNKLQTSSSHSSHPSHHGSQFEQTGGHNAKSASVDIGMRDLGNQLGEPLQMSEPFAKSLTRVYMSSHTSSPYQRATQKQKQLLSESVVGSIKSQQFEESKRSEPIQKSLIDASGAQEVLIVTNRSFNKDIYTTINKESEKEESEVSGETPPILPLYKLKQRALTIESADMESFVFVNPQKPELPLPLHKLQTRVLTIESAEMESIVFNNFEPPVPITPTLGPQVQKPSQTSQRAAVDPELMMKAEFNSMLGDIEDSKKVRQDIPKIIPHLQSYQRSATAFANTNRFNYSGRRVNTNIVAQPPSSIQGEFNLVGPRPVTQHITVAEMSTRRRIGYSSQAETAPPLNHNQQQWPDNNNWDQQSDALSRGSKQKTGIMFHLHAMRQRERKVVPMQTALQQLVQGSSQTQIGEDVKDGISDKMGGEFK